MRSVLLIISLIFAVGACAPYTMDAPDQFKKFNSKREFKMITADGVKLKVREEENYPKADLEFWTDATQRHLVESGYTHEKTDCFKTNDGLDACTLKFALPHGAEDWVFHETIFVVEDTLVLVEAAGEYKQFQAVEEDLGNALKTFNPNL